MTTIHVEMVYLGRSGLELAHSADDVRGMVVVDPGGLRLGVIEDVVIDSQTRRARLLAVVSGGILGMASTRALLPVETVIKVDDRVRVDRTRMDVLSFRPRGTGLTSFAAAYESFGVRPFWTAPSVEVYFHDR